MKHYSLVFNTANGSRRSFRVNNPNTDIPLPTIQAAVDQILLNDIFNQERGGLESLNRLELTRVEHEIII